MPDPILIRLQPLGKTIPVARNTPLADLLFSQGVEFPCGGRGRCRGCRIQVLEGQLPITADDERLLKAPELAAGWRLACRAVASENLTLKLAQWETLVLGDDSPCVFNPRDGYGVAIDLGTTTIVIQLLDLKTGQVLGVRTALNAQARYGADLMSRIHYALTPDGRETLARMVREQIGALVEDLLASSGVAGDLLAAIVLGGNTVMHHMFCGLNLEPLSRVPFETDQDGIVQFAGNDLGWSFCPQTAVNFLPGLGGFVGSDILCGILATGMHERQGLEVLFDLGTNGEIVVGNSERLLCASTAAGPAFEGARISMGMRAATGAISEVELAQGQLACRVLGGGPARGLCGSGLVDAVATGLDLGEVLPSGRMARKNEPWTLMPPVTLIQNDVRELQLAKGAIAAGARVLLAQWGARPEDVQRVHLAGAFGNYIRRASARRIGLVNFDPNRVQPVGNTALRGAKMALLQAADLRFESVRRICRHIPLGADAQFQDLYAEEMLFPEK